jgi:hypothetical protein
MIATRMGVLDGTGVTVIFAQQKDWETIRAAGMPQIKNIPWDIKTPMDFLRAAVERSDWKSVGDWYAFTINNILRTSTDPAKFWSLCTLDLGQFRKLSPFTLSDLYAFIIFCDIPFTINDLGREVGLGTNISPNDTLSFGRWLAALSGSDGAISLTQAMKNVKERNGRGFALGWQKEPSKHTASRIITAIGLAIVGGAAVSAALSAGASAVGAATATSATTGAAATTGVTTGQLISSATQALIKDQVMDRLQSAAAAHYSAGAPSTYQPPTPAAIPSNAGQTMSIQGTDYAAIMGRKAGRDIGLDALKQEVQNALNAGQWPGAKPNFSIDGALVGGCKGCRGAVLDDIVRTAVAGGEVNPVKILDAWVVAVNKTWGVKWMVPSNATTRQILIDLIDYYIAKYNPNAPYTYGAPVQIPTPTLIAPMPIQTTGQSPTVNFPIKLDPSLSTQPTSVQPTATQIPATVPVDKTGDLIQALIAQGASQQQAFTAALQSLASQGVQPTQAVQQQVAADVAQATTAGTGNSKSLWIAGGLAVLAVTFALARPTKRGTA